MELAVLEYFSVFLLVFARMAGMILVNPVFARRGVPNMLKIGLTLSLSILLLPTAVTGAAAIEEYTTFQMAEGLIREVVMGLATGYVFQLFFYMLYVAGDMLDTAFGLAMGKVMDPVSGIQTSIFGQFINVFFFLYFFATGCHLAVIRLFAYSYEVIPVGAAPVIGPVILSYLIHLFGTVFLMVIKLTLPFLAAEFILEATMGVLMKLIPQIHVFVINIQSKILLGILLMIAFAYPIGAFFDEYVTRLMGEIQNVLMMFA